MTEVEAWMKQNEVRPSRMLEVMANIDPAGRGVTRRTLYNAQQNGTMDTRTLVLMVAASRALLGMGEARSELTLSTFDQWCFLDCVARVVYEAERSQA